jgi:hypothetical protein
MRDHPIACAAAKRVRSGRVFQQARDCGGQARQVALGE